MRLLGQAQTVRGAVMSRIRKLDPTVWDDELRGRFAADEATALELGAMRRCAQCPEMAKGIILN